MAQTRRHLFRRAQPAPIAEPAPEADAVYEGDAEASPPEGDQAGTPVNSYSRAVQPREQYPLHFDLLMRDLYALGVEVERWQVIAADEVRLDEDGMDVEFTLVEVGSDSVRRRRVEVQHGALLRICDC